MTKLENKDSISEVCLYSDRALVTREAVIDEEMGDIVIAFSDLPFTINRDSVRVKGTGDFLLLDNNLVEMFLEATNIKKYNLLTEQVEDLSIRQKELGFQENIRTFLKNFFTNILPAGVFPENPEKNDYEKFSADDYKKMFDYISEEQSQIISNLKETEKQKRELVVKIEKLRREMQKLDGAAGKSILVCHVNIRKNSAGKSVIQLSYIIPGASWKPLYDARLLYKEREFELVSYATVSQQTGENWENVKLVLSTANPVVGAYLPEPGTWFIDFFVPPPPPSAPSRKKSKPMAKMDMAKEIDSEEVDYCIAPCEDSFGSEPEPCIELRAELAKSVVPSANEDVYSNSEINSSGMNVTFTCGSSQDIPSDGSEKKVLVSMDKFPVEYEYIAIPAVEEAVYLKLKITNNRNYPLIAGNVKVFRDYDFIGDSSIETIVPNEALELYMGIDDNIKIKRELLNTFQEKKGITGKDVSIEYKYKITVESYKDEKETVKIFERIPLSSNKDIEVKVNEYSQFKKEDEKGIMLLEITLNPKEKKEFSYSYSVRYPADKTVQGLI